MGRVNVWINDELQRTVRAAMPDLNLSAVLADGLRARLRVACTHDQLGCMRCGATVDRHEVRSEAVQALWAKVWQRLRGGDWLITSRQAAAIVHDVGEMHQHRLGPLPAWDEAARPLSTASPARAYVDDEVNRAMASWRHAEVERVAALDASEAARLSTRRGRVTPLPREATSRRRHPTSRTTSKGATPAPPIPQEETA